MFRVTTWADEAGVVGDHGSSAMHLAARAREDDHERLNSPSTTAARDGKGVDRCMVMVVGEEFSCPGIVGIQPCSTAAADHGKAIDGDEGKRLESTAERAMRDADAVTKTDDSAIDLTAARIGDVKVVELPPPSRTAPPPHSGSDSSDEIPALEANVEMGVASTDQWFDITVMNVVDWSTGRQAEAAAEAVWL